MSDYQQLFQKYNLVVARNHDLRDQIAIKETQWQKREESFKVTEKLTRELCEQILAMDQKEMKLGKAASWSSVPLKDLILRAKTELNAYRDGQTALLNDLCRKAEDRRMEIESLQEQIVRLKTDPSARGISQEDLKKEIEKEKANQEAQKHVPKKARNGKNVSAVEDDDDVMPRTEQHAIQTQGELEGRAQAMQNSVPATESRKNVQIRKALRRQGMGAAMTEELQKIMDEITDAGWAVIQVMGETGISPFPDIEEAVRKRVPTLTSSKIRTTVTFLTAKDVLKQEKIRLPLRKLVALTKLSVYGQMFYVRKFGKEPVPAEMDLIAKEHDNYEHGYGIRDIANAFREHEWFKSVDDACRKNPIRIADGTQYIPDILCRDQNQRAFYFEYEIGLTAQRDFNAKCAKMVSVTETLNFLAPNRQSGDHLEQQVEKWIESRGAKSLHGITVRIVSAPQIVNNDPRVDKSYQYVFKPEQNGTKPAINK